MLLPAARFVRSAGCNLFFMPILPALPAVELD